MLLAKRDANNAIQVQELWGGIRWGDWGQIQPTCRQQKRGARLFLSTHLGSRFKWPLPVGPLSYINLDYMMFIDNFGKWVYNDTQFLTQEQDSFLLLQFLLLGSSFQFRSYRSCTSLLSVFRGFFLNLHCCYWVLKNCIFNLPFLHVYFCVLFPHHCTEFHLWYFSVDSHELWR